MARYLKPLQVIQFIIKKLTPDMLPTKTLIAKVESLSETLNAKQLREFLDIMDGMASLVEEARALPPKTESSPSTQQELLPPQGVH